MSALLVPSFAVAAPLAAPPASTDPRARLRALRPDLPCEGASFRAALVLLAAPDAGFNIDRVARRTGVPRHWVAACARRLRDNGVWGPDGARVAWSGPEDFRFWNDVGVAEGRLLRRRDAHGKTEWAPAGAWAKAYDYVGPQADPGGPVLYLVDDEPTPPPALSAAAPAPCAPPAGRPAAGGAHPVDLFPGAAWLE